MANCNNGGDHRSYEGNSSLPAAFGPAVLPADPIMGDVNTPGPDPAPEANIPAPAPAHDQAAGSAVLNPLFCEQLRQFIMKTINSTLCGSQASGVGPSSQLERGGTPATQDMKEQISAGLKQDRSTPADFAGKEAARHQLPDIWQSLKMEMVELCQQVARDTLPAEWGIPFSEHIMIEELPAHFRAPLHLSAYDGTTDPAKHICKFENAVLLHMYTDGLKCHVFLTTLTNFAHQWFTSSLLDQLNLLQNSVPSSNTNSLATRSTKSQPLAFLESSRRREKP
ncbi:UNVERIFIED_CONTAM: hypothetical protein Slati_3782000 [Sesamum latifolium]|uniref:Uncharacterized protein n=1 Tax=Sesamum latifolium TaxID=2727402 RepID=A0AAW2U540_9LAMI